MARLEVMPAVAVRRHQRRRPPVAVEAEGAVGEQMRRRCHLSARVMTGERRGRRHLFRLPRRGARTRGAPLALNPAVLCNL